MSCRFDAPVRPKVHELHGGVRHPCCVHQFSERRPPCRSPAMTSMAQGESPVIQRRVEQLGFHSFPGADGRLVPVGRRSRHRELQPVQHPRDRRLPVAAFPDCRFELLDLVADGDRVVRPDAVQRQPSRRPARHPGHWTTRTGDGDRHFPRRRWQDRRSLGGPRRVRCAAPTRRDAGIGLASTEP